MHPTELASIDPDNPLPKKPLTAAQAQSLKVLRPRLRPGAAILSDLSATLAEACECDMDYKNCPVCYLLSHVYEAERPYGTVEIIIDMLLERAQSS